jgi:cell division protein FtsB
VHFLTKRLVKLRAVNEMLTRSDRVARRFSVLVLAMLVSCFGEPARAQSPPSQNEAALRAELSDLRRQYEDLKARKDALDQEVVRLLPSLNEMDEVSANSFRAYNQMLIDFYSTESVFYASRAKIIKDTENNPKLQSITYLISYAVGMLLAAGALVIGLYFAYLQFKTGLLTMQNELSGLSSPTAAPSIEKQNLGMRTDPTTLEISYTGVKITSSVVGLLIFVTSLLFFYLFLKEAPSIPENKGPTSVNIGAVAPRGPLHLPPNSVSSWIERS